MILVRADANQRIGAGHVMRCCAIAHQVEELGESVVFIVSDDVSRTAIESHGYPAVVVGGNPDVFTEADATALVGVAEETKAPNILIDSYAVTINFFEALARACSQRGMRLSYIDDKYTFETGFLSEPLRWPVDAVVNYGFGVQESAYRHAYEKTKTRCYIGPAFVPVRKEFLNKKRVQQEVIQSILVTCGSTNPNQTLEHLVGACLQAKTDAYIDVVVGPGASFENRFGNLVRTHKNVTDMAVLMANADIAVSAAGSTLYELAAVGVPTIAFPIVENQRVNILGFEMLHLGQVFTAVHPDAESLSKTISSLAFDYQKRMVLSRKLSMAIDGRGAMRIAKTVLAER